MRKLTKSRPSPALVIACIALVAALGGTAVASHLNGNHLRPKSVGGGKLKQFTGGLLKKETLGGGKVKKDTLTGHQIDESKLGTVPSAASVAGDGRFSVKLGFNDAVTLATVGPFTLVGQCVQDVTDSKGETGRDVARVLIATSEVGSVFDGTAGYGTIDPTTAASDRIAFEYSVPTGTTGYASGGGATAYAPGGGGIVAPSQGNGGAVNLFGAACVLHGAAFAA